MFELFAVTQIDMDLYLSKSELQKKMASNIQILISILIKAIVLALCLHIIEETL